MPRKTTKTATRRSRASRARGKPALRSMTGFGRAESTGPIPLTAEVRTVNHRFLEVSARLPQAFQFLESRLRQYLQERLDRGKVNLTVSRRGADPGSLTWNADLARRYHEVLHEMRRELHLREPISLGHILSHPDLLTTDTSSLDEGEAWEALRAVIDPALDDLLAMREAEGKTLERDFRKRLAELGKILREIRRRAPRRVREMKEKLRTRVAELLRGETDLDEDRLLLEAAFQADRMDVTEECVRLESHLEQFRELLDAGGAVGRKLNFLLQEMNREANTIGAKGNDVDLARLVIRLKEEIEILREQVQNVE